MRNLCSHLLLNIGYSFGKTVSYRFEKKDEKEEVKERKDKNDESSVSRESPVEISVSFSDVSVDDSSNGTFVRLFLCSLKIHLSISRCDGALSP